MESFVKAGGDTIAEEKRICIGKSSRSPGAFLADFDTIRERAVSLPPVAPDHLAVIAYSSGTTGVPKGVMLTHRNLATNLVQFQHQDPVPITDKDIFLNHLPFFHIYGMNVLMAEAIAVGATQVIMSRFDLEELAALIARPRATLLFTVPPVLLSLVHLPRLADRELSSLRYVKSGAAPLPPDVAREFQTLTGVPVKQGYGLTETSTTINADFYAHAELESVGPPLADTEERVLDLYDREKVLGPGEAGGLVVRGPQIMQGYWRGSGLPGPDPTDGRVYTRGPAPGGEGGHLC